MAVNSRGLVVLVWLTALGASAHDTADAPLREAAPTRDEGLPWENYLVPALENVAINLTLLSFNNLVTRMPFALISAESVAHNLQPSSWRVDTDYFITNQFGHAYHGNFNFNAARSSGLDFWWSGLYALITSLTWEVFLEVEPPSVNDQITTPIGGSLLGEALHRSALQLRRSGGPRWLTSIGAALLDPLGALNGALLAEPLSDDETLDPLFVRWQFGAGGSVVIDRVDGEQRARSPPEAIIAVLLVSGAPWSRHSHYDEPLSYFDLRADLSFPINVTGNLFIRGLLFGKRINGHGVWGLFGAYDYASAAIVRASGVGLGPGVIFQWQPFSGWYVQTAGLVGASPFAAAGQLLDVPRELERDYHVGPGVQSNLDVRVIRPGLLQLELGMRNWVVVGVYTLPKGFESITWLTAAATVPIGRWFGAGAEFTLADRRARFEGARDNYDTGFSLRLLLSVMTEPHFGVRPQN